MGLYEGRDLGLLTAWQANRQRVHRSVQWPSASRVPERPLVSDACRRPQKVGGLAQGLQRGWAAWGDGHQASAFPHVPPRRTNPADGIKPGKLSLPAVQILGADHKQGAL